MRHTRHRAKLDSAESLSENAPGRVFRDVWGATKPGGFFTRKATTRFVAVPFGVEARRARCYGVPRTRGRHVFNGIGIEERLPSKVLLPS